MKIMSCPQSNLISKTMTMVMIMMMTMVRTMMMTMIMMMMMMTMVRTMTVGTGRTRQIANLLLLAAPADIMSGNVLQVVIIVMIMMMARSVGSQKLMIMIPQVINVYQSHSIATERGIVKTTVMRL